MDFERLFPEQFRAFCSGPLSLCMERFGGIDSISLLDVRSFGGKDYPDRFPLPWQKRDGSSTLGRPLYSPPSSSGTERKCIIRRMRNCSRTG